MFESSLLRGRIDVRKVIAKQAGDNREIDVEYIQGTKQGKRDLMDTYVKNKNRQNDGVLRPTLNRLRVSPPLWHLNMVLTAGQIQDIGLVFGAAYTILDVRELDKEQLIKLRNPPGDHEVNIKNDNRKKER